MDRQTLLLLALGSLIASALTVGVCGWILFVREGRSAGPAMPAPEDGTPLEAPQRS